MKLPWSFHLDPLTAKKLQRFRQLKRGYYSFLALLIATGLSCFLELLINQKALMVSYEGELHFPTYGALQLGAVYGLEGVDGVIPVNYRDLQARFAAPENPNWVLMPPIPYGPQEFIAYEGVYKPQGPNWEAGHLLGTDAAGRDVLARLCYGFRTAIFFALAFLVATYVIGIAIGCLMGYWGGWFDLLGQRVIEIWSNVPFLYMVIIIYSVVPTALGVPVRVALLLAILVLFSWIGITYYMRTNTYKEKARDYVAAAQVLGASPFRIIFHHILPNTVATIVTFMPFTVVGAITAITALDFLGFGLPPPTPSIGELLKQGVGNLTTAPWILYAAFSTLVLTLTLVTFVGEAVREAFDPKKFAYYA